MYLGDDYEDGGFLAPSGGSKLHSLFGMVDGADAGSNETLKYTAPKQPKTKGDAKTTESGTPVIMSAVAVYAYKYVDGKYQSQGKLGAAILAIHSAVDYKVLLYVTRQQQVTHAKITPTFSLTIQENNYVTFHDDARVPWSLLFDTATILTDFAKQAVLAKALSGGPGFNKVTSLDLSPGAGGPLDVNDSVELAYTGWLLTDSKYGQVFDSNQSCRLRVGKGKVIKGWDESLMGMKKGGKRLVVIPPELAYGASGLPDRIPANSTLIFSLDILKVKLSKADKIETAAPPALVDSTDANFPTEDESSVKARSRSINEQIQNKPVKSDKAKLISRMAKMGQPMLPLGGAVVAAESSDEEPTSQEGEASPTHATRPPISPRPSRVNHAAAPPNQTVNRASGQQPTKQQYTPTQETAHLHQPQTFHQPVAVQPSIIHKYNHGVPTGIAQPSSDPAYNPYVLPVASEPVPSFVQDLPAMQRLALYQPTNTPFPFASQGAYNIPQQDLRNMPLQTNLSGNNGTNQGDGLNAVFVSETRQANTDLRLTLSKVTDKIDRALEKLDAIHSHNVTSATSLATPMATMEASILMHNIQRVVQENERLKRDLFDHSTRIESQNIKISELLQQHQRSVEQGHSYLEQSNTSLKEAANHSHGKILNLEQEKVKLTTDLSSVTSQLSTLQLELSSVKRSEAKLKEDLSLCQDNRDVILSESTQNKLLLAESQKTVSELTEKHKEAKRAQKAMEVQAQSLLDEVEELKGVKAGTDKKLEEAKKKLTDEKTLAFEELQEIKNSHEIEMNSLKLKLKESRQSGDKASAEQVADLEAELNETWSAKMEKAIRQAQDKHDREKNDLTNDVQEKITIISALQQQLESMKIDSNSQRHNNMQLSNEIAELAIWKEKYEVLREHTATLKQRLEAKLTEQQTRIVELEEHIDKQEQDGNSEDTVRQIKKVMNTVFQNCRSNFASETEYPGDVVNQTLLTIIKAETLRMIQSKDSEPIQAQSGIEQESETESESESQSESDISEDLNEEMLKSDVIETENQTTNVTTEPPALAANEEVLVPSEATITGENDGNPAVLERIRGAFIEDNDIHNADQTQEVLSPIVEEHSQFTEASENTNTDCDVLSASSQVTEKTSEDIHDESVNVVPAAPLNMEKNEHPEVDSLKLQVEQSNVPTSEMRVQTPPDEQNTKDALLVCNTPLNGKNETGDFEDSLGFSNSEPEKRQEQESIDENTPTYHTPVRDEPLLPSRTPPPLDEQSMSVIDDEEDAFEDAIEETFGSQFKAKMQDGQVVTETPLAHPPKPNKLSTSIDDDMKTKPPPLFGDDDDDDDDLDWLN